MISDSIDFGEVTLLGEALKVSLNTMFFGQMPLKINLGFTANKSIRGNQ